MHDDDGVSHTTQESKHCDVGLYCKTFLLKPCASHPPCIYLYGIPLCVMFMGSDLDLNQKSWCG